MNQEHCKSYWKWRQYRNMGVPRVSLSIGGGEDGVDQDKSADDLRAEPSALAVTRAQHVRAAFVELVRPL
ncbi:unnamed protein product, partial [Cuscuta epithymum]